MSLASSKKRERARKKELECVFYTIYLLALAVNGYRMGRSWKCASIIVYAFGFILCSVYLHSHTEAHADLGAVVLNPAIEKNKWTRTERAQYKLAYVCLLQIVIFIANCERREPFALHIFTLCY